MERTLARVRAGTSYTPAHARADHPTDPSPTRVPVARPAESCFCRPQLRRPAYSRKTKLKQRPAARNTAPRQLELSGPPECRSPSIPPPPPPPVQIRHYREILQETSNDREKLQAPTTSHLPMIDRHRVTSFARPLKGFRGIIRPS